MSLIEKLSEEKIVSMAEPKTVETKSLERVKLSLYQRLNNIQKKVSYVQKSAKGYAYNYAPASAVLTAVQPFIAENGVLLVPNIKKYEITEETIQNKKQFRIVIDIDYTWVNVDNPSETLTCQFVGIGFDDKEKHIGSALTYSLKYFLLTFFQIGSDKDDPDVIANRIEDNKNKDKMDKDDPDVIANKIDIFSLIAGCTTPKELNKLWRNATENQRADVDFLKAMTEKKESFQQDKGGL